MENTVSTETVTSALQTLSSTVTGAVSLGDVVSIIGIVFGAGISFVLLWFGARKIFNGVMSAVKRGKIRI